MVYNPTTHICQGTVAYPAKCNGIQYNPLESNCCVSAVFSLANQRCQNSVVETKCGANWYDATNTNLRCQNNVIETKCGANGWYDATNANLRCESDVVETKCGTNGWYDATNTNLRCENNIVEALCWTNWYNPKTLSCSNGTLFMTDSRDNQTYKVVVIGTQTWMAQNLNYNVSGSRCYNNQESNCDTYGRLYNWATAMNLPASCNSSSCGINAKHRGICPSDWHIPSKAEWETLVSFVGSGAGTKLMSATLWNSYSGFPKGTDEFGFSALPGGYGLSGSSFNGVGDEGAWWSSSEDESILAYVWRFGYSYSDKRFLFSVRCVKD